MLLYPTNRHITISAVYFCMGYPEFQALTSHLKQLEHSFVFHPQFLETLVYPLAELVEVLSFFFYPDFYSSAFPFPPEFLFPPCQMSSVEHRDTRQFEYQTYSLLS